MKNTLKLHLSLSFRSQKKPITHTSPVINMKDSDVYCCFGSTILTENPALMRWTPGTPASLTPAVLPISAAKLHNWKWVMLKARHTAPGKQVGGAKKNIST